MIFNDKHLKDFLSCNWTDVMENKQMIRHYHKGCILSFVCGVAPQGWREKDFGHVIFYVEPRNIPKYVKKILYMCCMYCPELDVQYQFNECINPHKLDDDVLCWWPRNLLHYIDIEKLNEVEFICDLQILSINGQIPTKLCSKSRISYLWCNDNVQCVKGLRSADNYFNLELIKSGNKFIKLLKLNMLPQDILYVKADVFFTIFDKDSVGIVEVESYNIFKTKSIEIGMIDLSDFDKGIAELIVDICIKEVFDKEKKPIHHSLIDKYLIVTE